MTSRTRALPWAAPAGIAVLALTLTACGGSGGGTDTTSATIAGLTATTVATRLERPWNLTSSSAPRGSTYSSASLNTPTGQHLEVTLLDGASSGVHSVICSTFGGVSTTATRFLGDCAGLPYTGAEATAARAWLAKAARATTASGPRTATFGGVRFSLSSSPATKTWILDLSPATTA
jgi:hypothetical protein